MTKKKNWLGILVLVTAFGLVTAGCNIDMDDGSDGDIDIDGSGTPTEVVFKFARALKDYNLTLMRAYCTASFGAKFTPETNTDISSSYGNMILNGVPLESINSDGDKATVEDLVTRPGYSSEQGFLCFDLVKVNGEWKINRYYGWLLTDSPVY
jgi:hypothetical protein